MKKSIVIILISLAGMAPCFAQQYGWVQVDTTLFAGDPFFSDLYFTGNDTGWITSSANKIYKTVDGASSFTLQPLTGSNNYTNAIHMLDAGNGYCGGQSGTIFRTTNGGDNWNVFNTMVNETLDISFPPGTDPDNPTGYACGNNGAVWRITASALTNLNTGFATTFRGISAPSAENVWFCGGNRIYYYNGTTFTSQLGPTATFNHIHFINNNEGWVVGDGGTIGRTQDGGSTWVTQIDPDIQNESLFGVFFLNSNEGWAVGGRGLILSTINGGTTWTIAANGLTANNLARVYFTSSTNGYIVGAHKTILKYTQVSAVEEHIGLGSVEVWPNPTRGVVSLQSSVVSQQSAVSSQRSASVELIDLYGNHLELWNPGTWNAKPATLELDLSSYPAGIYFIRIFLENQTIVKKIIKL